MLKVTQPLTGKLGSPRDACPWPSPSICLEVSTLQTDVCWEFQGHGPRRPAKPTLIRLCLELQPQDGRSPRKSSGWTPAMYSQGKQEEGLPKVTQGHEKQHLGLDSSLLS